MPMWEFQLDRHKNQKRKRNREKEKLRARQRKREGSVNLSYKNDVKNVMLI